MSDNIQNGKENGSSSLLDVLDSMLGPDAEKLVRENEEKFREHEQPQTVLASTTPETVDNAEQVEKTEAFSVTSADKQAYTADEAASPKTSKTSFKVNINKFDLKKLLKPFTPKIKRTPLEAEMRNAVEQAMLDKAFYKDERPLDASEDLFDAIERNLEKTSRFNFDPALLSQNAPKENKASKVKFIPNQMKRTWPKVVIGVLSTIIVFNLFLFFTVPGHRIVKGLMSSGYRVATHLFMSGVEIDDPNQGLIDSEDQLDPDEFIVYPLEDSPTPTPVAIADVTPGVSTQDPSQSNLPENTPTPTPFPEDSSVINVLLIGEESINSGRRSDTMMIASMDKDGGPLKLVSLMRDMYVYIPPYYSGSTLKTPNPNRLNAAYSLGGAPLLMETIEANFGIHCDSYAIVNFEGFKAIVDYLGGVEITLSEEEANYLNTTNYISGNSKTKCENPVEAGTHLVDGNRALGYCRIRKVATYTGLTQDFGRTFRQRAVLTNLFEKVKDSSLTDLYGLMKECLKYVKVSSDLEAIASECLETVVEKHMFTLDTFRLPVQGTYYNENGELKNYYYEGAIINGMDVLLPYYDKNAVALYEYLYENKKPEN